mgnify:CR=1 FL=1
MPQSRQLPPSASLSQLTPINDESCLGEVFGFAIQGSVNQGIENQGARCFG